MKILGIDCANKSLGISIIELKNKFTEIDKIYADIMQLATDDLPKWIKIVAQKLRAVNQIMNSMVCIKHLNVVDLIPGKTLKESSIVERSAALKGVVECIDTLDAANKFDKILIEYQMGPNDKTREVCSKIVYHYCEPCYNFEAANTLKPPTPSQQQKDIIIVGPSLKESFYIGPDGKYAKFISKFQTRYCANKAHSKYNITKFADLFKQSNMLTPIPKKRLADVADAALMTMAYFIHRDGSWLR